jgi:hypothetical protein
MSSAYEVRLHGVASAILLEALCKDLGMHVDTVLLGVVQDQATLHALFARIRDMGYEIVDVHQVDSRHCVTTQVED